MSERESRFTKTIRYFEEADLREANACLNEASKIMAARDIKENGAAPKTRRGRPPKNESPSQELPE
jgi:hypothetical protein